MTTIHLTRAMFSDTPRLLAEGEGLFATAFRYSTGVEAIRLTNTRGDVVVLPYLGQIVWSATFDGVDLAMGSMFDEPRPAANIVDTYGCLAFHSGLLRNGCPGPDDTHALHGEFAVAAMDSASLAFDGDDVAVHGVHRHVRGFGDHYVARPSVTLARDATVFHIGMEVENQGGKPMDLMYMCHVNFADVPDGVIEQPAPFTPDAVAVRTSIPAHVPDNPDHAARLQRLAADPAASRVLSADLVRDPELVLYVSGLGTGADGRTRLLLRRPQGDGFAIAYDPADFPHTVRWLMRDADHQVAAFALPSTCHPEGYLAERAKGHVRRLEPAGTARFEVELGYATADAADALSAAIRTMEGPA